jgi:uncharacterized membrane protein
MSDEQDTGYTSLRITKKLRDALKDLGKKGQSYEDIIWSLMASESKAPVAASGVKESNGGIAVVDIRQPPPRTQPTEKKEGRLVDDLQAIEKIKELWNSGHRNGAEISREVGYPRATVNENIKKLKAKGDLKD